MISYVMETYPGPSLLAMIAIVIVAAIVEPACFRFADDCDEWFDARQIPQFPFIVAGSVVGETVVICLLWVLW